MFFYAVSLSISSFFCSSLWLTTTYTTSNKPQRKEGRQDILLCIIIGAVAIIFLENQLKYHRQKTYFFRSFALFTIRRYCMRSDEKKKSLLNYFYSASKERKRTAIDCCFCPIRLTLTYLEYYPRKQNNNNNITLLMNSPTKIYLSKDT
jgi:hypothetical protein